MTVFEYLKRHEVEHFRIVTFTNWKTKTLYNSKLTDRDIPLWLEDSVIIEVYPLRSGEIEIEV